MVRTDSTLTEKMDSTAWRTWSLLALGWMRKAYVLPSRNMEAFSVITGS